MENKEILLLNDSFPPLIDGVANAVVNYARVIDKGPYRACVATPEYPGADDSGFDFPVVRYPGLDLRKKIGYIAGFPFEPQTIHSLSKRNIGLIHSHCPMASNFLARAVRSQKDVPIVLTYHTKFDIDINNSIHLKGLQHSAIRLLVESVSAADELWVVSKGAGENIRSLGYKGDYIVMENGVDVPKGRASDEEILDAIKGYDLPAGVPVFLFVGRLMWYKGLRIILDALAALKSQDLDFRMVFIGGGGDENEVKAYAEMLGLGGKCIFTGKIYDRRKLIAWYSFADLFLFPSTFDTNGLVVREAAACSLGTVMVGGSCASEGVSNGVNGLFIEENAASLAVCLSRVMGDKSRMRTIGENAAKDLYLSWDSAVAKAVDRYGVVMENYNRGLYVDKRKLREKVFTLSGDVIDAFEKLNQHFDRRNNL